MRVLILLLMLGLFTMKADCSFKDPSRLWLLLVLIEDAILKAGKGNSK